MDVRLQVLGPVCAWRDGDPVDLGRAGQRALLGLLALAGGQPLTRAEITAGIWPDREPPPSATNMIQTHVKHLRRLLEPDRRPRAASTVLRKVADGYSLHLPPAAVDVLLFRHHLAAADGEQRRGQLDRAVELLESALRLWCGPPLADLPVLAAHPKVVALADERLAALARYGELMIAAGRAADGLSALAEAAAAQPLNEAWQALLIQAYREAGRRGEAFATYHQVRRRLADDLGVDPGPALSGAHTALLHDERPDGPAPRIAVRVSGPVPAQLPGDVSDFIGRATELSRLNRLLDGGTGTSRVDAAVAVAVLSGTPGVGKTTLAVRWAHRVSHLFPDGQLYLNLRGFDLAGVVMDPGDALRHCLSAIGVPAERVPATLDSQAALYRSQLAGRRMLIVLDNARDAAQVRPLLPGAPGSMVVVTSRNQLPSLVAAEGAQPLTLGLLPADDARELLQHRVGVDRAAGEPRAMAEILDLCAGLPLALVAIGARAALSVNVPLSALADQLRRSRDRLDALTTGDPSTDLRAVLSWSYQTLPPKPARLFRLLGLHPGPDLSTPAAASLAGTSVREVRALLSELVRGSLIVELGPDRYTLHDLLRAFAAEVAERVDRSHTRRAATRRMLDHYLHSSCAADRLLYPGREPLALGSPARGVAAEGPTGTEEALAWFSAERAVLLAAVELAARVSTGHARQLAWTLSTFLDRQGHWHDLTSCQGTAVAAARAAGDPRAQAAAHRSLARAHTRLGRAHDARAELLNALDLYHQVGDRSGQGGTHLNLSLVSERQGRHAEALDHARQSLELFLIADDQHGRARALNAVGWYHALLGDHAEALGHCRQALALLEAVDDRNGQAGTWDSIGYAHHHLGQHAQALVGFRHAIALYREVGDRHLEALAVVHLGDTHEATGNGPAARAAWQEALTILDRLALPDAEMVRTKLGIDGSINHEPA